jgi:hypothetical protein|tara:strand:+ start:179 stop:487 length:309 start_codon:yes stop_codon:yes gene_type:complete
MLDNAGLKDLLSKKMVTPAAKREAVAHLQVPLGMSERRACRMVSADRKSMRYRSCRDDDDGDLRSRLRESALPNQRWSLDFVHDQLVTGRRFRVLNIVEDVT